MNTAHPIAAEVTKAAAALPEGSPLVAKAFLHLGPRAAVDQALTRLARAGELMRIRRGVYVRPVSSRFGTRPPATAKVVKQLAETTGETIVPAGAAAANQLGLTTQVPTREVYLTSGKSRKLHVGSQALELRHAPAWQLLHPQRQAGHAIRALAWAGRHQASHTITKLASALSAPERHALVNSRGQLPSWLAQHISTLVSRG